MKGVVGYRAKEGPVNTCIAHPRHEKAPTSSQRSDAGSVVSTGGVQADLAPFVAHRNIQTAWLTLSVYRRY